MPCSRTNRTKARRLLGENNKTGMVTELAVSGVFLAIGHTPNTSFLDGQVKTNEKGYVVWTTPARTYTSVDGVFAAVR